MTAPGSPIPSDQPEVPGVLPILENRRPGAGRLAGFVALFLAVASGLATFSAFPWAATAPGAAVLKVAFKHVSGFAETGVVLSREELEKLPRHMRPEGGQQGVSRSRRDTTVRVALDGRPILQKTYRPSGFGGDGPTFVYEELAIAPGRHQLDATLWEAIGSARSEAPPSPERRLVAEVEVSPGEVLLLELSTRQELALRGGEPSRATGHR
jgi:hypothetical protein